MENEETTKGETARYLESVNFNITKELVDLYKELDNDAGNAEACLSANEGIDLRTASFYSGISIESKKLKQKVLASLQAAVDKEQEIAIKKKVADRADADSGQILHLSLPAYRREFIDGKFVMVKEDKQLSITSDEVI